MFKPFDAICISQKAGLTVGKKYEIQAEIILDNGSPGYAVLNDYCNKVKIYQSRFIKCGQTLNEYVYERRNNNDIIK